MPPDVKPAGAERLRILIVDDDDLDRLAVRRCLHQAGLAATVDEARSPAETLQQVRSEHYDCILLDYYLPELDGLALLADIRELAPQTPVVVFTGRGDEDIAVEMMKAGAADYLPKTSLTPERLASGVRHALGVASAEHARRRSEHLLQLLGNAAEHLLSAEEPDHLVRGLFDRIKAALGVDAYFNYFSEADGLRLASWGGITEAAAADFGTSLSLVFEAAASRQEALHAMRIQHSEEPALRLVKQLGLRVVYCHPLLVDYRLLGYLCFASHSKDEFTGDELDFLKTISHYVTAAYERLRHIGQLREIDRRKDEFIATLSHELRDPLAPLHSMLEVAQRAEGDLDTLRVAHAAMQRQLGQLERLIQDLLEISRITQGRLTLRKQRVELGPIVQQAIEASATLVERSSHDLRVELPAAPIHVDADPVRLVQVFGNLLTNACKYTEQEGRILLSVERQGNDVEVTVKDTGIGISPDQLDSVFEMFSQVQSALERSQGGLGIGLTLVKRLVEMHDGSVTARSEGLGRGSEFVVRLPALGDQPQAAQPAAIDEPAASTPARILVVDDNVDSAMSLAMLLQSMGHTTQEANDGATAIETARHFRPDLVLLDIGLPDMNGYEVCRRLRAEPWGGDIVIVALTGRGQDEDRNKSREAGFDHHVIKPVAYAALMELLSDLPGNDPGSQPART
jgi:signal transduction histidine kinase/response regulator of citrate/malate metabolism